MADMRVLVVDDSPAMREALTRVVNDTPGLTTAEQVARGEAVGQRCRALHPDLILLDLNMPAVDGFAVLADLPRDHVPVVALSENKERWVLEKPKALASGAVDCLIKPAVGDAQTTELFSTAFRGCVHRVVSRQLKDTLGPLSTRSQLPPSSRQHLAAASIMPPRSVRPPTSGRILAIGASTGGTVALEQLVARFPKHGPPVLIAQHIPKKFSAALAKTLSRAGTLDVIEASDGQLIEPSRGYLAPGDQHLELDRQGRYYCCRLTDAPPMNRHKPSVDVLFHSVAKHAGALATAMLLTGMGRDGAEGLQAIRTAGGQTFAQDESSSVVWGMPKAAVDIGAATDVLSLDAIGDFLEREF